MNESNLIPNLFRTEYSKIVAVLCKLFGLSNMELAQDFVSDSFLKAAETWKLKGVPDNPKAWLYTVAKNNAKDYFRRRGIFKNKVVSEIISKDIRTKEFDIDLSEGNIKDSQLQMLFAICNPINSNESQIVLALRILCGFGIEEITKALLSTQQNINKRLYRAKKKLRDNNIAISFPALAELDNRLDNVLIILYLLFNEGYYSSTASYTIRKDLCFEAMRLLYLLIEYKETDTIKSNALMALFCFHSSRFEARTNPNGEHILFDEQDKNKWDNELILKGEFYLQKSAQGTIVTKYHLEALIAFWHSRTAFNPTEKWQHILQYYNRLLQIEYSPITALNRTYALAMVKGKETALIEAHKINLKDNFYYHSLLAELYHEIDPKKEIEHLNLALNLTRNENDRKVLQNKLKEVNEL